MVQLKQGNQEGSWLLCRVSRLLLVLVVRVISNRSVEGMMKGYSCVGWQGHCIFWSVLEFVSVTSESLLQKVISFSNLPPSFSLFSFSFISSSSELLELNVYAIHFPRTISHVILFLISAIGLWTFWEHVSYCSFLYCENKFFILSPLLLPLCRSLFLFPLLYILFSRVRQTSCSCMINVLWQAIVSHLAF